MTEQKLIDINEYHQQLLADLDLDLSLDDPEQPIVDMTSMVMDLDDSPEDKLDMPLPDIHQVVEDIDEDKTAADVKNLPLIARLGILGAKIREDPTGWFYFCATKNSMTTPPTFTSLSTKHVDLKAKNNDEAKAKFQNKAQTVTEYVRKEVIKNSPFAEIAQRSLDHEAYVNSSYTEVIQQNCMRIVTNQKPLQMNLPFNAVYEQSIIAFPYTIKGTSIIYDGLNCNANIVQQFTDNSGKNEYYYMFFSADNKRDQLEFARMSKRSNWPNFLWRENRKGCISHHYLIPKTSPAIFKTWMFLHQYYKSFDLKQKIDKYSLQVYFQRFKYERIDLSNWYGPQLERSNLDGTPVCAKYRQTYYQNGKYLEPNRVPMSSPTGLCRMSTFHPCTCFIYPGELLDSMKIALEIVLEDGKFKKKPVRTGKICFYCSTRYYGHKCSNVEHSKNLGNFVKIYADKYKIDATATDNSCKDCGLIVRVEESGAKRSLISNELVVTEEFFSSQHWKFLQSAYMSHIIYVLNYYGMKRKVLDSLDVDSDIKIEFVYESAEAGQHSFTPQDAYVCKKKKCDKLVNLYINDKIASVLQSTIQPVQFPEGYLLTLIPMRKVDDVVREAFEHQSSLMSVYDPMKEESLYKDYYDKKNKINKRKAEMYCGKVRHDERDDEKKIKLDDLEFQIAEASNVFLESAGLVNLEDDDSP